MTDTVAIEAPAGPVPLASPAPETAVDFEAGAPEADVSAEARASAKASAPAAERVMLEIERPIGTLRQAILDHLLDTADAGPQSVAEILQAMPIGTSRNTLESGLKRNFDSGLIERTAPGRYVLAKPKPPEPAPPSEPVRADEEWLAALEAYFVDPKRWDVERFGPGPDQPNNRIPPLVRLRFVDRLRKRDQRRKDAEAAAAKRAEADAALRDKLIAGCFGNFIPGPAIDDITVVKAMLADGVPLDHVLIGLKRTVDRRIEPRAAPISTWRDERFLINVARSALLGGLLPRLVDAWSKAGIAPQKAVDASNVSPAVPGARGAPQERRG